ncbi:hypothetical protein OTU49_014055, partial [Cherax quadricarinatus]
STSSPFFPSHSPPLLPFPSLSFPLSHSLSPFPFSLFPSLSPSTFPFSLLSQKKKKMVGTRRNQGSDENGSGREEWMEEQWKRMEQEWERKLGELSEKMEKELSVKLEKRLEKETKNWEAQVETAVAKIRVLEVEINRLKRVTGAVTREDTAYEAARPNRKE